MLAAVASVDEESVRNRVIFKNNREGVDPYQSDDKTNRQSSGTFWENPVGREGVDPDRDQASDKTNRQSSWKYLELFEKTRLMTHHSQSEANPIEIQRFQ